MSSQRNVIVYFGIIQYELENAMCQRSDGIIKLINAAGYDYRVIGVNSNVKQGQWNKKNDKIYEVNYPNNYIEWGMSCISSVEICSILMDIGIEKIKTFIMADYRLIPMGSLKSFCKKHEIIFCIDVMDWFQENVTIQSKIKAFDNNLRLKFLYPFVRNRIYICSSYEKVLGVTDRTAIIPGVITSRDEEKTNELDNSTITLFFAGCPGDRCEKEKIDWVIKAISQEVLTGKFKFYVAGVEKSQFIKNNPEYEKYINENVCFLGRISHKECINYLSSADFSLIIRPDTQVANYGFSTKIGEAFKCGIPVLVTDTSDNKKYVLDGENGFVSKCSYDAVYEMLICVSKLSRDEIRKMKKNTMVNNTLNYENYLEEFKRVIE